MTFGLTTVLIKYLTMYTYIDTLEIKLKNPNKVYLLSNFKIWRISLGAKLIICMTQGRALPLDEE